MRVDRLRFSAATVLVLGLAACTESPNYGHVCRENSDCTGDLECVPTGCTAGQLAGFQCAKLCTTGLEPCPPPDREGFLATCISSGYDCHGAPILYCGMEPK